MAHTFIKGTWQQDRAFSPAVITEGGRTIWVAGHGATTDADGRSLAGDFEAQTHESFRRIAATLEQVGATMSDIVSMTVYVIDSRHGTRFTELRKSYFPDGNFPASALITCSGFANPDMMVEIMPVAVIAA